MNKKVFIVFYILAFIANTIPIFFNKYIMSNMSTSEYINYQALWTIVLWFQPAASLGSQNNIRVLANHNSTHEYVNNTIIISIGLIAIGFIFGVDLISMICALMVTLVSYSLTYLESSKQFIKSSIFKFIWLFLCGIGTLMLVKEFGSYSRIISSSAVSLFLIIYFKKTILKFKNIKFNKFIYTNYGVGLSFFVVIINLVFYSDRIILSDEFSEYYQYQFACGYFLMNMIVFSSRPLILLSEIGINSSQIWNINKSYFVLIISIFLSLIIYLFRDLITSIFFFSYNLSLESLTVIIWLIIGVLRVFSDLLIPLINKSKIILYFSSILLLAGYFFTVNFNFLYVPVFYILFFTITILIILYDFYTKHRSA